MSSGRNPAANSARAPRHGSACRPSGSKIGPGAASRRGAEPAAPPPPPPPRRGGGRGGEAPPRDHERRAGRPCAGPVAHTCAALGGPPVLHFELRQVAPDL